MSKHRLNKEKAFELISPVIDGEADEHDRIAFFEFIEEDDEIRIEYESVKRIKTLVSERYLRQQAPERLRKKVDNFIASGGKMDLANTTSGSRQPIDQPSVSSINSNSDTGPSERLSRQVAGINGWWWAAAVVLFAALMGITANYYTNTGVNPNQTYDLGQYVQTHFQDHNGKLVQPNIQTASLVDAEVQISEAYNMAVTVPPLRNAEFKGVAYSDFVPGFKTPLLEYYLPNQGQYIYIYAFNLDQLNSYKKLKRHKEAVSSCIKSTDFHVRNINGKHVVSWKWGKIWYSAISNHDGQTLASLVEPLKYSPSGK